MFLVDLATALSLTGIKVVLPGDTCLQQILRAPHCHCPSRPGPHQKHTLLQRYSPTPSLNPQGGGKYLLQHWAAALLKSD